MHIVCLLYENYLFCYVLQTIRTSDLEYIKDLGSGTFGTVFYGKWKGSDVAIKRIKPSCFTEGSLEADRLVITPMSSQNQLLKDVHHHIFFIIW